MQKSAKNWADIKAKEKARGFEDSTASQETFLRFKKHLDWDKRPRELALIGQITKPVLEQVELELAELKAIETENPDEITHEIGDVLLSMASLSRHLKVDPEGALRKTNRRFTNRFQHMEQSAKNNLVALSDLAPHELEMRWTEAKTHLQNQKDTSS